jgi:hypothetical protein
VPPAWVAAGPPLCPFRLLTGLPCPGCGITRSIVSTAHGDLAAALAFHPLGPLVLAALIAVALSEAARRWVHPRRGHLSVRLASGIEFSLAAFWPWIALGAFLAVWAVRLPLYLAGRWTY